MSLYGLKWPLAKGEEDTFQRIDNVESQISYYLRSILLTNKGENLSDPDYGVGIKKYIFEQNITSIASIVESSIREQLYIYLPYINVLDIIVESSSDDVDNNSIRIKIIYRLPNNITQVIFELEINDNNTVGFY